MENFVKLPIALLTRTDISSAAKVLYALMLDRRSLSVKNQWADSTGTYIYYTRSEAAKALNVSERQAQRIIKELTEASLIERKVQGRNKPYKIYVKVLVETKMSPPGETKMSPPEETKMSPEPYRYNHTYGVSGGRKKAPEGYPGTYSIEEYEATSITDFMHEDDPEEPEAPQTQKTENLTIPDQKL